MTNYPIGPYRTPIYVILPVHITLMPMQMGQLRHKTYMPKLVPYILPSSAAVLMAVSIKLKSTQCRSATINAIIKCTQCWSFLFIAAL